MLVEPLGLECVCMYDVQQISYYNIFIQIYADIWYFPSTYWSCRKLTTGFWHCHRWCPKKQSLVCPSHSSRLAILNRYQTFGWLYHFYLLYKLFLVGLCELLSRSWGIAWFDFQFIFLEQHEKVPNFYMALENHWVKIFFSCIVWNKIWNLNDMFVTKIETQKMLREIKYLIKKSVFKHNDGVQ